MNKIYCLSWYFYYFYFFKKHLFMKSTQSFLLFLFSVTIIISCKKQDEKENSIKEYNQLKKASWFLGNWENNSKGAIFKEIWSQKNDSSYFAESFVIVEKDTVFYEKIDLVETNNSLIYIVSVKDQNKEKPVSFYMTKSSEKELVFENPKHDFPTKIVYTKITNDSLVAVIYGKKDGKKMSELFPMKKTN